MQFDIIIIGSGLGGLLSAVILAKEGKKVAVLEQNKQVGGCLQTFSFDKKIFDSCVHYVGALDEGQTQNRIFKYAGIMENLKLKQLDSNCFDEIIFGNDAATFHQAQGDSNFVDQLLKQFPEEKKALQNYIALLEKTAKSFPLYTLRNGIESEKNWIIDEELCETIKKITDNKLLQNVLTGNNLLYAGEKGKTPFFVHALVTKSYIESAYKLEGGSSQITKHLWKQLQEYGGVIYTNEKVASLITKNGQISKAITNNGNEYFAKQFIANVHPKRVLEWIDSRLIKPIYKKRINEAKNSISAFMVNIVLKPKTIPYQNHNTYWNRSADSFVAIQQKEGEWPMNYALYFNEDKNNPGYADTLAILTYDTIEAFDLWEHTHNRTAQKSEREADYHEYKHEKAELLLKTVAERFPEIRKQIHSFKIATPLTFRDYMGTADGSMYGIMPEANRISQTKIPAITKIPNLFLTGQNTGLHGVLGVSISAINTCGTIIGHEYLLSKINKN